MFSASEGRWLGGRWLGGWWRRGRAERVPAAVPVLVGLGAVFLANLDASAFTLAVPLLHRAFPGTPAGSLAMVQSAYGLGFAALILPAGQLVDRHGPRGCLLAGLALFAGASVLGAVAPVPAQVYVARGLTGAGIATAVPAALALLLGSPDSVIRRRRAAQWGATGAAAAGCGPVLGGLLGQDVGWRGLFVLTACPAALMLALLCYYSRLGRPQADAAHAERRVDLVGPLLTAVACLSGLVGLQDLAETGARGLGLALVVIAAGLAAVLTRRGRRRLAGSAEVKVVIAEPVLRRPGVLAATAASAVVGAGVYALQVMTGLTLVDVAGLSVVAAGLWLAPASLVAALLALGVGRLGVGRLGAGRLSRVARTGVICAWGGLLLVGGAVLVAAAGRAAAHGAIVGIGLGLVGLAVAATCVSTAAALAAGPVVGRVTSINQVARQAGGAIGAALAGASVGASVTAAGLKPGWLLVASLGVLISLMAMLIRT